MTDHRLILALKQAMDDRKFIQTLRTKKPAVPAVKKAVKRTPVKTSTKGDLGRDERIDQVARLIGN